MLIIAASFYVGVTAAETLARVDISRQRFSQIMQGERGIHEEELTRLFDAILAGAPAVDPTTTPHQHPSISRLFMANIYDSQPFGSGWDEKGAGSPIEQIDFFSLGYLVSGYQEFGIRETIDKLLAASPGALVEGFRAEEDAVVYPKGDRRWFEPVYKRYKISSEGHGVVAYLGLDRKGNVLLKINGGAFRRNLFTSLISLFVHRYAYPASIKVREIHLAVDIPLPYDAVLIALLDPTKLSVRFLDDTQDFLRCSGHYLYPLVA